MEWVSLVVRVKTDERNLYKYLIRQNVSRGEVGTSVVISLHLNRVFSSLKNYLEKVGI